MAEEKLNPDDPVHDRANYKAGLFYYCRKDDRLMPKKSLPGTGWEINFAHRSAPYLLISILLGSLLLTFGLLYIAGLITGESFFKGRTR